MTQEKETVILSYQGILTLKKIEEILLLFKEKVLLFSPGLVVQRRVYSILVECLENTYRHNVALSTVTNDVIVYLEVIDNFRNFEIKVGNFISNDKIDAFVDRIDIVNSLDKDGLNKLYRKSILKSKISKKGGAGLGIIEIARNSNLHIDYELSRRQETFSFLKMSILVAKIHQSHFNMSPLLIEETIATPMIILDYNNNNFKLMGCSRPEDVREFYGPIIQWLIDFKESINSDIIENHKADPIVFKFNFDYFNSSSAKFILDILVLVDDIHSAGLNTRIDWYYDESDDDMKEVGEELSEVVDFPFEYVIVPSNNN